MQEYFEKDRKLQKIYKEDLKITAMIVILFENQIQTTSASPYRTQNTACG